jgi:hypothetical protein
VYVRDVPEDSEDLFNIVYFFDMINNIKNSTFAPQGLQ